MASTFCDGDLTIAPVQLAPVHIWVFLLRTIAFCIFPSGLDLWLPKQVLPESAGCFENPTDFFNRRLSASIGRHSYGHVL